MVPKARRRQPGHGVSGRAMALAPRPRVPKRGSFLAEPGGGAVRFSQVAPGVRRSAQRSSHVDRPVGPAPALHHCRHGAAHSRPGHVVPHAHDRGHFPRDRHPGGRRRVELSGTLGRGDGASRRDHQRAWVFDHGQRDRAHRVAVDPRRGAVARVFPARYRHRGRDRPDQRRVEHDPPAGAAGDAAAHRDPIQRVERAGGAAHGVERHAARGPDLRLWAELHPGAAVHDSGALDAGAVRWPAASDLDRHRPAGAGGERAVASTLAVVEATRQAIPAIQAVAPEGLELKIDFDQSLFVRAAISGVVREAILASVLVSLMIFAFLGSWRSVVIVSTSIPLAIFTAFLGLKFTNQTINIMTLGGLALAIGMLVDDATVAIENIHRNRALVKPLTVAVLDGAQQVAVPAIVATLAICIVFFPVALLQGPAKYLFTPLALAVVFAMLASYVLSRTLVPLLARLLMPGEEQAAATPSTLRRKRDEIWDRF